MTKMKTWRCLVNPKMRSGVPAGTPSPIEVRVMATDWVSAKAQIEAIYGPKGIVGAVLEVKN